MYEGRGAADMLWLCFRQNATPGLHFNDSLPMQAGKWIIQCVVARNVTKE
jgi:hypothetical protein